MATQHIDEVLGKALSTDSTVIPRFTLKDAAGNTLAHNATIELDNPVTVTGTHVNKQVLDECLAASGILGGTDGTLTLVQAGYVLVDGAFIRFRSNRDYIGACTLNINGTGAKTVLDSFGSDVIQLAAGCWYTAQYASSLNAYIIPIFDPFPVGHMAVELKAPNAHYAVPSIESWERVDNVGYAALYDTATYPELLNIYTVPMYSRGITIYAGLRKIDSYAAGSLSSTRVADYFVRKLNNYEFFRDIYDNDGVQIAGSFAYRATGQNTPIDATQVAFSVVDMRGAPSARSDSYWGLYDIAFADGRYYFMVIRATSATATSRYIEIFSAPSLATPAEQWIRLRTVSISQGFAYFAYSDQNRIVVCTTSNSSENPMNWWLFPTAHGAVTDGWNGDTYTGRARLTNAVQIKKTNLTGGLMCSDASSTIFYTFAYDPSTNNTGIRKLTIDLSSTTVTTPTVTNFFGTTSNALSLYSAWMSSNRIYALIIQDGQLRMYQFASDSSADENIYTIILDNCVTVPEIGIIYDTAPSDLLISLQDNQVVNLKFISDTAFVIEKFWNFSINFTDSTSSQKCVIVKLSDNTVVSATTYSTNIFVMHMGVLVSQTASKQLYVPDKYSVFIKYR